MEVIVAPKARGDIASILAWTEEHFGLLTFKRYAKLIATAIEQVAENPERDAKVPEGMTRDVGSAQIHLSTLRCLFPATAGIYR